MPEVANVQIKKDGSGFEVLFFDSSWNARCFKYSKWEYVLEKLSESPFVKKTS